MPTARLSARADKRFYLAYGIAKRTSNTPVIRLVRFP